MPAGESYLVVGGCGFLGRHIVEALLARGEAEVAVFDLVQRHFDHNVTFYVGDISKYEDVSNAVSKSKATTIFHTASPVVESTKAIQELVNITGTSNLLDACVEHHVKKLVYTSSAGVVFDGVHEVVCADERLDYPAVPLDSYNETKTKAEKMVLKANDPGPDGTGLMTCAIRPAGIFGPGDRQQIIAMHNIIVNNQTKFQIGDNDNLADFTHVKNVVHGHILAADKLGTIYPYASISDPLPRLSLTTGPNRIPTSDARPLGPNNSPTEADLLAAKRFEEGYASESDAQPVLRNRMDAFLEASNKADEDDEGGIPIAGQAFFITNGEPAYFWDYTRSIWRNFGHVPPSIWKIPASFGVVLATLAELYSKIAGKQPTFTKYRVAFASTNRYYDIEKARRLLGYEPLISLEDGLKEYVEWYKGVLEERKLSVGGESEKTK